MVGPEEVRKVAELAKLTLRGADVTGLSEELGRILAYIELLKEAEEGTASAGAGPPRVTRESPAYPDAPLRPDVPGEVLPRAVVLEQAPGADGEMFRVPPVLEDGGHA